MKALDHRSANTGSNRITVAVDMRRMLRRSMQLRLRYGIGDEPPTHAAGRFHVPLYVADRLVDAWRRAGISVTITGEFRQRREPKSQEPTP